MKQDVPTFDPEHLDALASVGVQVVTQVVEVFIRTGEERIQAIARALGQEDWEEVHGLAHSLKGSAASVGAARLSCIAGALELEAGHDRPSVSNSTRQAHESIEAEFSRAKRAIEEYVEALEGQAH